MNKEKIKKKFPSICYSCENARQPASDSNITEGWVGCCILIKVKLFREAELGCLPTELTSICSEAIGTGWVDMKSKMFTKKSGIITNFQLVTKCTTNCDYYEDKN